MEDDELEVTDQMTAPEPAPGFVGEQQPSLALPMLADPGVMVGDLHRTIEEYHRLGVDVQGDVYFSSENGERVPVGEYVTEPDGAVYVRTRALAPRDPKVLWMRVKKLEE